MSTAQEKIDRVLKTLNHEEPDCVPVGEFFWTNFLRRCKKELDVGDDSRDIIEPDRWPLSG